LSDCQYFYERALKALARRGFVRGRAQTAEEFLAGVSDTGLRRLFAAVIQAYNAARFGGDGGAERRLPELVAELEHPRA
jgi:hypothetical protein